MKITLTRKLNAVKKFYFLEYFYVLLKSAEKYTNTEQVFNNFRELKQNYLLGESKYKKLTVDGDELSKIQIDRYRYTFKQVIFESEQYKLINLKQSKIILTPQGERLIHKYETEGAIAFNQSIFRLIESNYLAFKYIVQLLYSVNKYKQGLLVLPIYSPRQLNFDRSSIRTSEDIINYSWELKKKLEEDLSKYIGNKFNLDDENYRLLEKLFEVNLISREGKKEFSQNKYNVITKRFRDFWFSFFLRKLYLYQGSLSSFDIWTYRAKQIGIIYATEFYPNLNGRVVYPTSIIVRGTNSKDFRELFNYDEVDKLYIHEPSIEANQDNFVNELVNAYFDIRKSVRSYFVNLLSIKEIVCYKMKIADFLFEKFLNHVYKLNLSQNLRIKISLEVDKLPEETKAIYLKQEPIMVDGKFRNIIAIDYSKGDKNE